MRASPTKRRAGYHLARPARPCDALFRSGAPVEMVSGGNARPGFKGPWSEEKV